MTDPRGSSRRNFLAQCLTGAVALGAGASLLTPAEQTAARSRVAVARDPLLRGKGSGVDPQRLKALLDRAMQAVSTRTIPRQHPKTRPRRGGVLFTLAPRSV